MLLVLKFEQDSNGELMERNQNPWKKKCEF